MFSIEHYAWHELLDKRQRYPSYRSPFLPQNHSARGVYLMTDDRLEFLEALIHTNSEIS